MVNTGFNGDSAWRPVKIGAGGWLTGIDIAPDGAMVARADTYGAYLWNGGKWVQLVTSASMPTDVHGAGGVYEIRISASDSNILYMQMDGSIFKSIDRGGHWIKTAFSPVSMDANGGNRMDGEKMAIDPSNPDIVFAGTQQNGLFVTHDGGASWQSVSAVPRGNGTGASHDPGLTGIVFDKSGGVANGATRIVYVATEGSGVYRSSDGGATWAALNGGPTDVSHAVVGSDGSYYATGDTDTALWKYAGGVWRKLIASEVHAVAIDPFDPKHIIAVRDSGHLQESRDSGQSWSGWNWSQRLESSDDVPWLENSGSYMSSGNVMFDPLVQGRVWQSSGVGVWNMDLPANLSWNSATIWNSSSAGVEQLVANDIIAPAGGNPVFASWDRAFFEVPNPDSYATGYGGGSFSMGWSLDYASTNSRFVVGLSNWFGSENSGFSTDGGVSWQKFAGYPSFAGSAVGGSIAASSPNNFIWAPAGGHAPAYTKDGGATWNTITLPGNSDWGGLHHAYWLDRTTVTADRVLPNTFYLYDAASGVYATRDGGASWVQVFQGQISPWSMYNAKIEAVPGRPGELFFTSGPQDSETATTPADIGFMRSVDGGASWQAVANVKEVSTFGYGAAAAAGGTATVFIVGWVNNNYGIWYSTDSGGSWVQIGNQPMGSLDVIKTISGDMDRFGSVYVGFSGSGYAHLSITNEGTSSGPAPSQTVTITSAEDDVGTTITVVNGALINDTTPRLQGFLSAPLITGQVLAIFRDGQKIGQITPATTAWTYTDPGTADGAHSYSARVESATGQAGTESNLFSLVVDATAPLQLGVVTSIHDDAGLSRGSLANGAITDDTSPALQGVIALPLGFGEALVVFRNGLKIGQATVSDGTWVFGDSNVANGRHRYTTRVEDSAGNSGAFSAEFELHVESLRLVNGTARGDVLVGSTSADRLSGIPESGTSLGKGTIDILAGPGGADLFVVGDARGRFYDDGKSGSSGSSDFAIIRDFDADDRIQLNGSPSSYLQAPISTLWATGMGIFHDSNGNGKFDSRDELIAIVQNHGLLEVSDFLFI